MTKLRIEKVGLIANYSKQGDWAFKLAFETARSNNLQLNIFHFLESPYDVSFDMIPSEIPVQCREEKELIERDRSLREYYDELLEDYIDVGFRICEKGRHNYELKQCLKDKEYQLLIIPYLKTGVSFGNMPIEEFAYRFIAPVILVGPDQKDEFHVNPPAKILIDSATLDLETWKSMRKPTSFQELTVI